MFFAPPPDSRRNQEIRTRRCAKNLPIVCADLLALKALLARELEDEGMKLFAKAMVTVLGLGLHCPAPAAETNNGNELLATCSAGWTTLKEADRQQTCQDYLRGALDVAIAARLFCPADGVTYGQLQDIIVNGLRAEPAIRHRGSAFLIAKYLGAAFPCPK